MITVITGTPGAGKTLHAIDKLLRPLVGQFVEHEVDGVKVQLPRTIYTNINGLLLDHELVQADGEEGFHNWHKWAKPGAVIVIDEFQRIWPPRPNGSKIPDDISALDTHRHMGVDFILMTQNVMNADRHIQGLTNRHLHVRRMANMRLAIVYEWDHCSKQLMYAKALTKAPWRYDKSVFKLYKSAEVHTKQPRKLPGLVWFIAIAIVSIGYFAPATYARIQDRIANGGVPAEVAAKKHAVAVVPALPASGSVRAYPLPGTPGLPDAPMSAALLPAALPTNQVFAGCVSMRGVCSCYDSQSNKVDKPALFCEEHTGQKNPISRQEIPASLVEYQPVVKPREERTITLPKEAPKGSTIADVVAMYRR